MIHTYMDSLVHTLAGSHLWVYGSLGLDEPHRYMGSSRGWYYSLGGWHGPSSVPAFGVAADSSTAADCAEATSGDSNLIFGRGEGGIATAHHQHVDNFGFARFSLGGG